MTNNFFRISTTPDDIGVASAHIREVNNEVRKINYRRFFIFSIVVTIIELLLIVFYDIPAINKYNAVLHISIMYFVFHFLILITSLTVFFILNNYRRNESSKVPYLIIEVSILFFMIFMACIGVLDQIKIGQITSYISVLMLCGVLALIKPPRNYIIYSISHIVFIFGCFLFQKNQGAIISNIINGTILYFSVLVMSKLTYENQVNILIKNIILEENNKKLEYLSNYDGLTNLFNRRYFETFIKENITEEKKDKIIAIMDIDYFKSINDRFGHKAGDMMLQKIAIIISENIREIDLAARWGGEEFIILFSNISIENAEIIVNTIREKIEQNVISFDNNFIQVTASFGLTKVMGTTEEDFQNCFKTADKALYLAKANGRNRVERCGVKSI
ncbi:diguanylate cyclase (GGDEF) domain-containing protein [Clostridium acidisoli DSM 12555]|uniref:Diguanylate cyclase (GGDEF) domain-containing protein n=1 Tax=Clostridium acidisoli DSM 12555 TaxID=1121291 RepID=A0A1W1WYJ9_9CLOT|nr:GGDEF domain-containing protein [Clostridium acidisoli]SMC16640.1 diguanylate cyclase (GGDEF) domain-containing protein [Clostridium acidisoli DSM 12555]